MSGIATEGDLDFSAEALAGFLRDRFRMADAPVRISRIGGGQSNPTYAVSVGERRMALRKQPAGPILKGAHAVDREFRVLSALSRTDVPVPEPILFHDDPGTIGTPFYLMDWVEGRVFHEFALPGVPPEERRAMFFAVAETLAALHRVDPVVVGLGDFGRHHGYFERQLARWGGQLDQSPSGPLPMLAALRDWLGANMPPEDGTVAITHGDFRMGNILFHPTDPRVAAVLDWELSTLGHPMADLGFCLMAWNTAPEEYGGLLGLDLAALGIPSADEFVGRYADAGGRADLLPFHVAFALFRFAVIFVGIADRVRAGTAAGRDAEALGPLAVRFAERGLEVAGRS